MILLILSLLFYMVVCLFLTLNLTKEKFDKKIKDILIISFLFISFNMILAISLPPKVFSLNTTKEIVHYSQMSLPNKKAIELETDTGNKIFPLWQVSFIETKKEKYAIIEKSKYSSDAINFLFNSPDFIGGSWLEDKIIIYY